jgi:ribosomal protein L34E
MSGVIDDRGQQWEHCNRCGKWVKIQKLHYEEKSAEFPYGRDLCLQCALDCIDEGRNVRRTTTTYQIRKPQ